MELLKLDKRPAEYRWKDVTFFYRTTLTVGDKFEIDSAGTLLRDGRVEFQTWEFYRAVVRRLVVDWKGVTQDGNPVPYSFERLMSQLPPDENGDLVTKLAIHIALDIGLLKKPGTEESDLKNESRGPSNG